METVSREDVVRAFLVFEAGKKRFSDQKDEILSWCELPDEAMMAKAAEFADSRKDKPAVWAYTVYDRSRMIDYWTKGRINSHQIFTMRINRCMAQDLEAVQWNLYRFAMDGSKNWPEFGSFTKKTIPEDKRCVIVIKKQRNGRDGEYELIDGSHRLVGLIRDGQKTIRAYIGHLVGGI